MALLRKVSAAFKEIDEAYQMTTLEAIGSPEAKKAVSSAYDCLTKAQMIVANSVLCKEVKK